MKKFLILSTALCLLIYIPADAKAKLTLQESIDLALKNNNQFKNSELEIKAAGQSRKAAITNYFPSISAGGMQFEAEKPLMEMTSHGLTMGFMEKGYIGYIGAVQPIFAGGRIINGNKLAGVGVEVSKLRGNLTHDEVVLKTREQYWQIISLQEKAGTLRAYEVMLDSLLKQVEDAYESGMVMRNDVLKVRLKRSEVLLNKSKLDNGISLAKMAFCQYIGLPLDTELELMDSLTIEESPQSLKVNHSTRLSTRDEYRLLELSVRAEKLKTRLVRGEYLPQLAIGANYQQLKFDDGESRTFGFVYGTVSVPISGWWGGSHELRKRKREEQIAENNLQDNSQLLLLQMEKSWQDLDDSYTQYRLSLESREQATENMKVNQDSYDNGLTPVSDLLDARALLQQAEDQLAESKAQYLTEKYRYLQVTGQSQD